MKELRWLSLALLVVGLAVWGGSQTAWAQASTTTYFMHGYGSSAKAERQMTNYLVEQGISNTVVLVSVDRAGYATLHGSVGKNAVNPLVKVEFADSRNTDFHQDGQWLRAAIAEG